MLVFVIMSLILLTCFNLSVTLAEHQPCHFPKLLKGTLQPLSTCRPDQPLCQEIYELGHGAAFSGQHEEIAWLVYLNYVEMFRVVFKNDQILSNLKIICS